MELEQFEEKLPARITGLVFWGLVFIGLLAAVIFLHNIEKDVKQRNLVNLRVLAYEIENIIEQHPQASVLETTASRLRLKIHSLQSIMNFHAVKLSENNKILSVGVINKQDNVYTEQIHYYSPHTAQLQTIQLKLYCPSVASTIARMRKQILFSVGISVIVFGFFLQMLLQRILSTPFQKMVTTASAFSQGDENARFDDKRQDEFGYLGGFINNAIDTIVAHKNQLLAALKRVEKSEQALNVQKEYAEITLHSITDSVITVDQQESISFVNPATELLVGKTANQLKGKPFKDVFNIINEKTLVAFDDPIHQCFASRQIIHLPEHSSLIIKDGSLVSVEASIAPMKSEHDDLIGAVVVIQDVSHTRRLTRQLSYQASHDLLTGLYNRRKFEERLEEILLNVVENERFHALFYMDLDNFKIVNDTCGHVAGDELLKQLPALFNNVLRSGDLIARLGGDEFGILLENCKLPQAVIIADKIRQTIKDYRFVWNDKTFEIGISIGVVGIDSKHSSMAEILSSADIACYAAKDSGRNRVHIFESTDEVVSERFGQMHWTARISDAFVNDRLRIFQQPIMCISEEVTDHYEILIRMLDETGDIIPPGAFLPAAERYGLMPDIDRWVIAEAFKYMASKGRGGKNIAEQITSTDGIITINLSGDSINDDSLLDFILQQKTLYNISLSNICFEVTETVAISNLTKATSFINALKQHGCKFALDDFGSGLSSFTYLKTLPVDYLKIDGSFVRGVAIDEVDRAMVESIHQVGKAMNLKTIAEQVEDEATLSVLKEIGIDYVQGYLIGKPQMLEAENECLSLSHYG